MNITRTLSCLALVLGAAHPALGQCGPLEATLAADEGWPGAQFGSSVSISGDRAVIGTSSPHDYDDPGVAYVFQRGRRGWRQAATLKGDPNASGFGRNVSISGRKVAVTGLRSNTHVFEKVGGTWEKVADLGSWYSASMSANRLLTGDGGSVTVWERVDGIWEWAGGFGPEDQLPPYSWFGLAVGLSGDTAVVGAWSDDATGDDSGSAYVFERSGDNWRQIVKLVDPEGGGHHYFGAAVSISGDTLMVGRPNGWGQVWGAVFVYERSGGIWEWSATLTGDPNRAQFFGESVSISGDRAVVGAAEPSRDRGREGENDATAYVFERIRGVWRQTAKLRTGPMHGQLPRERVGVSGDTVLVGSPAHDGGQGEASGLAYVFNVSHLACAADFNGDGWVDVWDFQILIAAWGPCDWPCPEDLDGDCNVGDRDLEILQANFGRCP